MAALPFETRPLTPHLGAEVVGVQLAQGLSDAVFDGIHAAFLRHQVLLFEPQDVPPATQVAFARRFGEVQVHVMNQYHAGGFPELYRLSNLDEHGRPTGRHPTRARWRGTPTARGHASPARPPSFTARWCPRSAARPTSATCTAPTSA
jgi:alpha-ketoglutarate-dependent taurine dioxygenase